MAICSPPNALAGKLINPSLPLPLPSIIKGPLLSPAMLPGTNKVPSSLNVQYGAPPAAFAVIWKLRSAASTPILPTLPMLTQSVLTLPDAIKLPPVTLPVPANEPLVPNVHSFGEPKRSVTTVKLPVELMPGDPVALALPSTRLPVAVVTLTLPVTLVFPLTVNPVNVPTLVILAWAASVTVFAVVAEPAVVA